MAFDYLTFLQRYNIDRRDGRRDWIDVVCPWCGPSDPHRLGINYRLGIYHCWHGASHCGKSPHRLVQALLGCTSQEASRIVEADNAGFEILDDESFVGEAFRKLGEVMTEPRHHSTKGLMPLEEFMPVRNAGLCRTLVYPYLERRGYGRRDVAWLADRYGLMFASTGMFAYRIIVPVVVDHRMVNWTGRSVAASEALRYKSLSTDLEKARAQGLPVASKVIKDCLFDYDNVARGGETLVISEGPFDAMRLGFLGERSGIRATCLFGKMPTAAQVDLLMRLAPRYDEVVCLLDADASMESFLSMPDDLRCRQLELPRGVKDPAELDLAGFCRVFGL